MNLLEWQFLNYISESTESTQFVTKPITQPSEMIKKISIHPCSIFQVVSWVMDKNTYIQKQPLHIYS